MQQSRAQSRLFLAFVGSLPVRERGIILGHNRVMRMLTGYCYGEYLRELEGLGVDGMLWVRVLGELVARGGSLRDIGAMVGRIRGLGLG